MSSTQRHLPPVPNADKLRKQAKARLAELRLRAPGSRLSEAQLVLAREYGFADWPALLAEVARRVASPAGAWRRIRRAPAAVLPFWRMAGPEGDETPPDFVRAGAVMSLGVLLALVGLGVVVFANHQGLLFARPVVAHYRTS